MGWSDLQNHPSTCLEWCFFACWRKNLHFFALVLGGGFYIWWVISFHRIRLNKIVHFPICWRKRDKTCWNMSKPPRIKTSTKKKGPTSLFVVGWHCRHWEKEYSTVKSVKRCGNHAFANMWMHWKQDDTLTTKSWPTTKKDIAHFKRNPSNPPVFCLEKTLFWRVLNPKQPTNSYRYIRFQISTVYHHHERSDNWTHLEMCKLGTPFQSSWYILSGWP